MKMLKSDKKATGLDCRHPATKTITSVLIHGVWAPAMPPVATIFGAWLTLLSNEA